MPQSVAFVCFGNFGYKDLKAVTGNSFFSLYFAKYSSDKYSLSVLITCPLFLLLRESKTRIRGLQVH